MSGFTEVGFIHLTTDDGKRVHTQVWACDACGALTSAVSLHAHMAWHRDALSSWPPALKADQ